MLLPVSALQALLTAKTPTGAAANEGLVVCADVAGLWAAAGWAGVLAAVPAPAKADQAASKHGKSCQKHKLRSGKVVLEHAWVEVERLSGRQLMPAVLCCAVLCCAVLCCAVLRCAVLCCK